MEYSSYKELFGKTLKIQDIVIFKVKNNEYSYIVKNTHLKYYNEYNQIIFEKLKLDKRSFCNKHYGYETNSGLFPSYEIDDYKAATKVVLELFKLCDNYVKTLKEIVENELL